MDFHPILRAALRSQAAYIEDAAHSKAAFEALGYEWLGQYQNAEHQAVVSRDSVGVYLSISGTRFSDGRFGDLFEDVALEPLRLLAGPGAGGVVTSGAYNGMDALWSWAKSKVELGTAWTVDGHSLGAWRARYTPLFVAAAQIVALYSFESPKGGDAALWKALDPVLGTRLVSVVNGVDLFVSWPFVDWFTHWSHPAYPVVWLQAADGSTEVDFQMINPGSWPGGRRLSDHSIDLVVQRLATIVASKAVVTS